MKIKKWLKEKHKETSPIDWQERFIDIREDYNMLWNDYKGLICKIGKLPNAAHIRKQLNRLI